MLHMITRRAAIAAAAAAALLCSERAIAQQPPVKIGAILPLTGPGTFEGQQGKEGMEAMAALINASGGVLGGRKIELVFYDDKSSPEEGVSAAKRAIEQDKVDVISANMFSPVALAMKEVTRDKILHFVLAPQHPNVTKEGHKWLFRLNETTDMRGANFSKFICEQMKPASVAILAINDDYGRSEAGNFEKFFKACGIDVKGVEYFQRGDTDFTVQMTKIRSFAPAAVYVAANQTSQGATIYKQARQLGYKGTLIASGGNMNPTLLDLAGPALEGVYSVSLYVDDQPNATAEKWRAEYQKMFNKPTSFVAALSAQSIEILAQAMTAAGTSNDYDKLAQMIRSRTWDTLMGPVKFDDIGQAYQASYIIQAKGGKIVTSAKAN